MVDFSEKQRKHLAKTGAAQASGSFPIRNRQDLLNAIKAYGRSKTPEATKKHIIQRAKSLGLVSLLPDSWKKSSVSLSAVESLAGRLDKDDLGLVAYLSDTLDDNLIELSRQHSLAVVPGDNNWIEKTSSSGLPDYISRIALALIRNGMTKSHAIATAISTVKRWASGVGNVNADTRARATKALAKWEALKAKNAARKAASKVSSKGK